MRGANRELIDKVETLKVLLVSRATGQYPDEIEYKNLRSELIAHPQTRETLPRFVHRCRTVPEFWSFIKPKFGRYAERCEYLQTEFDPLLTMLEAGSCMPSDAPITATVQSVDSVWIQDAWQKALERRTTDPEGAITSARTLLESVCKHILDAAGTAYDEKRLNLPGLYSLTAKQLNLSPSQHTESLFQEILSGCQAVVEGLGSLRNRHSDAHGKGVTGVKPAARHAELAVNLAGTMATFLLQTWEARQK